MWVVYIAAIYCIHVLYNYMIPWYWYGTGTVKNGEDQRFRLRDAIASSIV